MAPGSSTCLVGLVVLALISISPAVPANAISCTEALTDLLPCQTFLLGFSDITVPCCEGANALLQSYTNSTKTDRKSVCECVKQAALSFNINEDRAIQLTKLCNITAPLPIRLDVNCSAIQNNEDFQAQKFQALP
ncbi:AAI domain-containing protein [Abeliophyllum distichum]|uniref:AAI domain-containing protein n=1 Tax=Abeliophyllum distichum TaxID=126358 RepID=A0ABD1QIH6_9LAMI